MGKNTTVGVLSHATGRFDPYVLCYSPLLFLMYKLSNTKNTSAFDSKSNFLRIGLSSHCLSDKGLFAPLKKASCSGYGARRPLKWKNNH